MTTLIRPCASSAAPVVGGTYMFDRGTQHVPRFHQGIDIGISTGTPLYGCGDGRVVGVVRGSTGGGYYVIVRYLANGETVDVITMHMSRIDVAYGDAVTTSTQLGLSGGAAGAVGSGQSTGSHLHLQISVNQILANPDTRLMSRTATAGGSGTPINPQSSYGPTTAERGGTLIPTSPSGVDPMSYSIVKDATSDLQWVVSLVSGNRAGIQSSYHKDLLTRVKAGDSSMLEAELNVVQGYLAAVNPPTAAGAAPAAAFTPEQIQAIAAAIVIPAAPHEFIITGKASA